MSFKSFTQRISLKYPLCDKHRLGPNDLEVKQVPSVLFGSQVTLFKIRCPVHTVQPPETFHTHANLARSHEGIFKNWIWNIFRFLYLALVFVLVVKSDNFKCLVQVGKITIENLNVLCYRCFIWSLWIIQYLTRKYFNQRCQCQQVRKLTPATLLFGFYFFKFRIC